MFDTVEQAQLRLNETVVLYDGRPCIANHFAARRDDDRDTPVGPGNITCRVTFLDNTTPPLTAVRLNDPAWGFHNLRLGFVNAGNKAIWVSRLPRTTTRWGIDPRNLRAQVVGSTTGNGNATRLSFHAIGDALLGAYPTWAQALRLLGQNGTHSVAFSRHFALLKDRWDMIFLYYKSVRIAYSEDGGETFRLTETYNYLREIIQQEAPTVRFNNAA